MGIFLPAQALSHYVSFKLMIFFLLAPRKIYNLQ